MWTGFYVNDPNNLSSADKQQLIVILRDSFINVMPVGTVITEPDGTMHTLTLAQRLDKAREYYDFLKANHVDYGNYGEQLLSQNTIVGNPIAYIHVNYTKQYAQKYLGVTLTDDDMAELNVRLAIADAQFRLTSLENNQFANSFNFYSDDLGGVIQSTFSTFLESKGVIADEGQKAWYGNLIFNQFVPDSMLASGFKSGGWARDGYDFTIAPDYMTSRDAFIDRVVSDSSVRQDFNKFFDIMFNEKVFEAVSLPLPNVISPSEITKKEVALYLLELASERMGLLIEGVKTQQINFLYNLLDIAYLTGDLFVNTFGELGGIFIDQSKNVEFANLVKAAFVNQDPVNDFISSLVSQADILVIKDNQSTGEQELLDNANEDQLRQDLANYDQLSKILSFRNEEGKSEFIYIEQANAFDKDSLKQTLDLIQNHPNTNLPTIVLDNDAELHLDANGEFFDYHVQMRVGDNADTITGTGENDLIFSGDGNDIILSNGGRNIIDGEGGENTLSYELATKGVDIDMGAGSAIVDNTIAEDGVNTAYDIFDNINNIIGSAYNDTILGDNFNNIIEGGEGRDSIDGGYGSDILEGGEGIDTLVGGSDTDIFVISKDPGSYDIIEDFEFEVDILDLSAFADVFDSTFDLRYEVVNGGTMIHLGDGQGVLLKGLVEDYGYGLEPSYLFDDEIYGINPSEDNFGYYYGYYYGYYNIPKTTFSYINSASQGVTLNGTSEDILDAQGNVIDVNYKINDNLTGSANSDVIYGLAGNDNLSGLAGTDIIYGDDGNDTISGGDDDDKLFGGDGDDAISGGDGNDTLRGDLGDDFIDAVLFDMVRTANDNKLLKLAA